MRALWRVARLGRPMAGRLGLAALLGAGAALAGIGLMATSGWLISRAAQQPPVLELLVAVTAVRAFGISRGALRYLERLAGHDAAFRVLGRLRGRAYERLERLAPAGLAELRAGDLLERLVGDVDGLADLWLRVTLPYSVAILAGSVAVVLCGLLVPMAGAVLALSLLLAAVAAPALGARASRIADCRLGPLRGALSAGTLDVLAGADELRVAGAAAGRLSHLADLDARLAAEETRVARGVGLDALVGGLAAGSGVWLALVAGIAALRSGQLEGVMLAVVALTVLAAHEAAAGLGPAAQHLPGLASAARRVFDVLDRPDPAPDPLLPLAVPAGPYTLRIRGLRARYAVDGPPVLDGIDLEAPPGGRVLVTGSSGSGKSTLAATLLRFLEPEAGSLELVGGHASVDLRQLRGDDVRRVIGLCAQDPHVFDTTLAENLRLARPGASDDDVRSVLRRAQLLPWVESLPHGLDTLVGESGSHLSAGQRQRLSLARALLADFPIVIFDEPTEHLDDETASALVEAILNTTQGRTVIFMTHRPELMKAAGWTATVQLSGPSPAAADLQAA
jgi:ATP-binding cassette, subfamily C, bacterial CydCD